MCPALTALTRVEVELDVAVIPGGGDRGRDRLARPRGSSQVGVEQHTGGVDDTNTCRPFETSNHALDDTMDVRVVTRRYLQPGLVQPLPGGGYEQRPGQPALNLFDQPVHGG